jgi:WD40 repeat protein
VLGGCDPRNTGGLSFWFPCDTDSNATLWDSKGNLIKELKGHEYINQSVFSPDGRYIATTDFDGTICLWDAQGNLLKVLNGQPWTVWSVAFRPDSSLFVTTGGSLAKVWDMEGNLVATIDEGVHTIESAIFDPSGTKILTTVCLAVRQGGCPGGSIARLWTPVGHAASGFLGKAGARKILSSPDNNLMLAIHEDGTARLWQADGKMIAEIKGITDSELGFDARSSRIFAIGHEGRIRVWNTKGNLLATFSYSGPELTVNTRDSLRFVTSETDNTLTLRDVDGHALRVMRGHQDRINSLRLSEDGDRIVSASSDGTVRLWSLDATPLAVVHGQGKMLIAVAASQRILTVSQMDKSGQSQYPVQLWDQNGKLLAELDTVSKDNLLGFRSIIINTNGTRLITFSGITSADPVQLWDMNGKLINTLDRPDQEPDDSTIFSAVGTRVLMVVCTGVRLSVGYCSDRNAVFLWDQDGAFLRALTGNADISSASFSPDGSRVLVIRVDGGVELYDNNGNMLAMLKGQASATFTPDGSRIVLGEQSGIVWQWKIWQDVDEMQAEATQRAGRAFSKAECQQYLHERQCPLYINEEAVAWALKSQDIYRISRLCVDGTVEGYAQTVLPVCEWGGRLAPNNPALHSSLGIARALTGDAAGAIADLEAAVEYATEIKNGYYDYYYSETLHAWIDSLKAGQNPFDEATLKELRTSYILDVTLPRIR